MRLSTTATALDESFGQFAMFSNHRGSLAVVVLFDWPKENFRPLT